MVTDTAFYRYRHYHAPTDTPDKLAYPEFANVTLGLFRAFAVLAREGVNPPSPTFMRKSGPECVVASL
jgi:hypothetical protein